MHRAGWDVVPIKAKTKRPLIDGWQRGFTTEQIDEYAANGYAGGNVGLLARKFPGADIDVTDEACADAIEHCLRETLGDAPVRYGTFPKRLLMYAANEPFAKVKLYLTGPDGDKGLDGKKHAVEFLGDGQQYVIYGEHPDGFDYDWPQQDGPADVDVWDLTVITRADIDRFIAALPDYLPEGWKIKDSKAGADAELTAFENYKQPLDGWDLERVDQELLPFLSEFDEYETWVRVGMALHHQFEGDLEALDLWDQWSQQSGKWVEGACESKWTSFSEQRFSGAGAVTLASLILETKEAREKHKAEVARSAIDEMRAAIEACSDDTALRGPVAEAIRKDKRLDKALREILVQAWNLKHRELAGVKLPVADVRNMLGAGRVAVVQQVNAEAPDWVQPWVFVTEGDKFFNLDTKQEVTSQGFRVMHNRLMPFDENGNREKADIWAADNWSIPVVAHKAYMPSAGPVFEMFGLQWVNLYRPDSAPDVPEGAFTPEQLAAIDTVLGHFRTYLADEREQQLLLSWIAHQVQHPGVKVRWSPYIHGVPGDGKSFFSELIAVAMGAQNVRSLNGSTLESNFTDWAVGYAVVAIEEMKQHGHNRYDIMNRVKPFITNTAVEIHPKGKPSYTAPNVSNYIIFSNYLDGAPVDDGDRRYMFVSSQLTTEDAKRLTEEGYFTTLFGAVNDNAGAIRKWLLSMQMHPEFDANGRAPDTDVKHTVVEMSKSDLEVAAEELIEKGAPGVSRLVVSSAHMTRALQGVGEPLATTRVNTLLTRLGYRFFTRKKWRGEACRIWVKQGSVTRDEDIITHLDASMAESFDFLE